MNLLQRIQGVRQRIADACNACQRDPASVELLPVSKRHPSALIVEANGLGLQVFGENRVQELVAKSQELAGRDLRWQLIGSLQTNKVGQLLQVANLELLQSLDRMRLAKVLQEALAKENRSLPVLLQVNATGEEQKHGFALAEVDGAMLALMKDCPNLQLQGLMAMGPLQGDPAPVFAAVAAEHRRLQQTYGLGLPVLSMGMSQDLEAAVAAGSTLVRVGTAVFGPRQ